MGVGRLHPLVSLQFEMNMLPVKWEAMRSLRSLEFWICVIGLGDGRIVKKVVRKAIKVGSRVRWVRDLIGLEKFEHRSPEWIINERGEAGVEEYCMEEG